MDIQTTLPPFLTDLVTLAGTVLLGFLTVFVRQHFSAKQVDMAKSVAKLAVSFANELDHVTGIKGEDKLKAALEQAKSLAGKYGINLTDDQWTGLIKSTVNESRLIWESVQGYTDELKPVVSTAASDTAVSTSAVVSGETPAAPTITPAAQAVTAAVQQAVQVQADAQKTIQDIQDALKQAVPAGSAADPAQASK